MKQMINTTDYAFDVERYRDEADAISFAGNLGMDGFELLPCDSGGFGFSGTSFSYFLFPFSSSFVLYVL